MIKNYNQAPSAPSFAKAASTVASSNSDSLAFTSRSTRTFRRTPKIPLPPYPHQCPTLSVTILPMNQKPFISKTLQRVLRRPGEEESSAGFTETERRRGLSISKTLRCVLRSLGEGESSARFTETERSRAPQ